MSIRCVCPNGHVLKVKEALAGTSGLCPTCRARVNVPRLQSKCISEDAILDIVGRSPPDPQADTSRNLDVAGDTWMQKIHEHSTNEKHCYKCQRGFPSTMHICPFCHTYIANLRDF